MQPVANPGFLENKFGTYLFGKNFLLMILSRKILCLQDLIRQNWFSILKIKTIQLYITVGCLLIETIVSSFLLKRIDITGPMPNEKINNC